MQLIQLFILTTSYFVVQSSYDCPSGTFLSVNLNLFCPGNLECCTCSPLSSIDIALQNVLNLTLALEQQSTNFTYVPPGHIVLGGLPELFVPSPTTEKPYTYSARSVVREGFFSVVTLQIVIPNTVVLGDVF